jgi:hypothetical protein
MIGTPRNDSIAGWFAGDPADCGCAASRRIRIGRRSLIKRPSTPCPVGSGPIAAFPASSIPAVKNWLSPVPLSSITPSAAYRARNTSRATSAIFCSTRSSDGSVVNARLACISACICALSSVAMRSRRPSSSWASLSVRKVSAFSMPTPACEASITATCSSASENSPPPCFSVTYRPPYALSRTMIGTPRNDSIAGWFAGDPADCGCAASRRIRIGRRSLIKRPSTPCPVGSGPIAAFPASSIPAVKNWLSPVPLSSITPSAAYRARNTSRATSAIFCSTRSSDGSVVRARLACISACIRFEVRADEAKVIAS